MAESGVAAEKPFRLTSHEQERRGSVDSSDSGKDSANKPAKLRYKVRVAHVSSYEFARLSME